MWWWCFTGMESIVRVWSLWSDVIVQSVGERPAIRRGPPYPQWPNDRQHYEYHGVPFRGRGGMGYMSRGGGWFARRGLGAEMGRGMRRRPIINRSRSRSRSRSSRSRSRSRTRTSSRSRSAETGSHGRKRGVNISCIDLLGSCLTRRLFYLAFVCLSVCLSVSNLRYVKVTDRLFTKILLYLWTSK